MMISLYDESASFREPSLLALSQPVGRSSLTDISRKTGLNKATPERRGLQRVSASLSLSDWLQKCYNEACGIFNFLRSEQTMNGKYSGIQSVEDFLQALFQDQEFFRKHGITHLRDVNLYFTPCDKHGNPLTVRNSNGDVIDGYRGSGAYKCVADTLDTDNLEATEILSKSGFKPMTLKDKM